MTVVDTSVIIAAFASWHEQHEVADRAIADTTRLIAHCAIESFSVLTRLPPPHRAPAALVRDFLAARFPDRYIVLNADGYERLLPRLVELGVSGAAAYDALVGLTAFNAGATLVSCDQRAALTYGRLGIDFRLLG